MWGQELFHTQICNISCLRNISKFIRARLALFKANINIKDEEDNMLTHWIGCAYIHILSIIVLIC